MKLVIFGAGDIAQLAHYYFSHDSDYEVVAFTVDRAYLKFSEFCGLPVVPFEEISGRYPPAAHHLFVAVGYVQLNAVRRDKYLAAKAAGYRIASYISSRATVLNGCDWGENCFVLEQSVIQPFVKIGNNVTIWSGSHIGHHSTIGDDCFIAPCAAISGRVKVGTGCFIGINATLRDHISIGERCVIGAGALLLSDTEPDGVYRGNETKRCATAAGVLKKV